MKYLTIALLSIGMIAIGSMQAFQQTPQEPLSALEETEKAVYGAPYQDEEITNYLAFLPGELREQVIQFRASSAEKAIQMQIIEAIKNHDFDQFKKWVSLISPNKQLEVPIEGMVGIPATKYRNLLYYLLINTPASALSLEQDTPFKLMLNLLIKRGINLNAKDIDGDTILHEFLYKHKYDSSNSLLILNVLKFLLQHGANPNILNKYGASILDIANNIQGSSSLEREYYAQLLLRNQIIALLKLYGAKTGEEIKAAKIAQARKALYEDVYEDPYSTHLGSLPAETREELMHYIERSYH